MNSRERLLTAIKRGQPDRVPVSTYELVGYNSKSFENIDPSYAQLMQFIREKTDCVAMWNPDCNAVFLESAHPADMRVLKHRQGDATFTTYELETTRGRLTRQTKVFDSIQTVWQTEHWCKSTSDVDAALCIPFEPLTYDWSDLARIKSEVGDRGIIMASVSDPLWITADLMEFGQYTTWAALETDHFESVLRIMHERCMENLRRMLAGGVVDLYRIVGPEYAAPPFLSPRLFERFVVPYVREMVDLIHAHGALARLHCHGRIGKILEAIADTGADAIDPCEAPTDGDVDLSQVKERVGDRMCIFGNVQLKLLEGGTEKQVEEAVITCMNAAKAGGGFVIMPTAAPISSPLAAQTERNYIRFIETALEHGKY